MKKIIMIIMMVFILLASSVIADDLYSYIGLYTDDGDVYVNIDSGSNNGSVHNYYNGEELIKTTVKKMSDNTFYSKIADIFTDYSYDKKEWHPKTEYKTYTQYIASESFNRQFMPRTEVYEELGKLKFEIMVLQEQLSKQDCHIRKKLMIEYNLPSITCGEWTYVNYNGEAVTIESLIPKPLMPKPKIVPLPKTYSQDRIDVFQDLCDRGINKFCLVLEQINN